MRAILVLGTALLAVCFSTGETFAFCGDAVDEPSEECDATAPGGDAACPGACIPGGALGQCTCARPVTDPRRYVVIADRQAKLGTDATVGSGHVAVTAPDGFLLVGKSAFVASQSQSIADSAKLLLDARIGRLFANRTVFRASAALVNGGPFAFAPPLALDPLPPFPAAAPGPVSIDVPPHSVVALPPGAYGTVLVGPGATLVLHGLSPGSASGRYDLEALMLVSDARVLVDNPVVVNVAERVSFFGVSPVGGAVLGPAEPAALLAGDVQINVGGSARFTQGSTLTAYVRVPTGSVRVGKHSIVTGRLVADKVVTARGVTLFHQGSCGDGTLEAGEQCDPSVLAGDAACAGACIAPGQPGQCTCPCDADADCNDGNACNGVEHCQGNVCVVGIPPDCHDENPCTRDCDPGVGCVNSPLPNGTSCSDENACTAGDGCQQGVCTPGPAVTDGSGCSDRNKCTVLDTCIAGACVGGTPRDCSDGDSCTADACDEIEGCRHTRLPDGEPCTDGNGCTTVDRCDHGVCVGSQPRNCDDGNTCSADSCGPELGCVHLLLPDGTACGDGKTCRAGTCG
jgi:hypothetical protein